MSKEALNKYLSRTSLMLFYEVVYKIYETYYIETTQ
jgi:hypothetical protein